MIVNPEYAENLLNPPDPEDFEDEDDEPSPDDWYDQVREEEALNK